MKRTWLGFGDLAVGERFRFVYGVAAGVLPTQGSTVYVKTSPRRYGVAGSPGGLVTGASTAVARVRDEEGR